MSYAKRLYFDKYKNGPTGSIGPTGPAGSG